jgi:hypothetical protein
MLIRNVGIYVNYSQKAAYKATAYCVTEGGA